MRSRPAWRYVTKSDKLDPNTRDTVRLTRETEYALKGLAALARRAPGETVPLAEVATTEGLPASFLAKIFQKLARGGILIASRGAGRGYALAQPPSAISALDVAQAVQGSEFLDRCLFWGGRCGGTNPCLLHERWLEIKPQVRAVLEETSIADFARHPMPWGTAGVTR